MPNASTKAGKDRSTGGEAVIVIKRTVADIEALHGVKISASEIA